MYGENTNTMAIPIYRVMPYPLIRRCCLPLVSLFFANAHSNVAVCGCICTEFDTKCEIYDFTIIIMYIYTSSIIHSFTYSYITTHPHTSLHQYNAGTLEAKTNTLGLVCMQLFLASPMKLNFATYSCCFVNLNVSPMRWIYA